MNHNPNGSRCSSPIIITYSIGENVRPTDVWPGYIRDSSIRIETSLTHGRRSKSNDGQAVSIRIAVIVEHMDDDRTMSADACRIVEGHRSIINWRYSDGDCRFGAKNW